MTDQALRRSDELLTELTELVETARALPMSSACVLPRERVLDLLDELREVLPPEIDQARVVVAAGDRLIQEAQADSEQQRARAVADADAVAADARHQAEALLTEARAEAAETVRRAAERHEQLVAATTVHQAAAAAAAALREDAERYQQQVAAEAHQYDAKVRADADRYAHTARVDSERYATKLTTDAETYAERTLDELCAVLGRASASAEQGRAALSQRRAGHWAAGDAESAGTAIYDYRTDGDERRQPPISA